MRVIFCILLTVIGVNLFANDYVEIKESVVVKMCEGTNVDPECILDTGSGEEFKGKNNYWFRIPIEYDCPFANSKVGKYHNYANRYDAYSAYVKYCEVTKQCQLPPEHPNVDLTSELVDIGDEFKTVNIETGLSVEDQFIQAEYKKEFLACKKDDPRSFCKQLNEDKKEFEIQTELRLKREDLLKSIIGVCTSDLADLTKFDPHVVGMEIATRLNDLQDVNEKIK